MGEWLKKMLAKAKELWGKWSGVQKGILIGIVVVVIALITTSIFFYHFNGDSFDFSGSEILIVPTGSMDGEPQDYPIKTIPVDSLIMIHSLSDEQKTELKVGDVVTFHQDNRYKVHRIIEIDGEKIITKGDANSSPDAPIKMGDIDGKVAGVAPNVGKVVSFIRDTFLNSPLLMLLGAVIIVVMIYSIIEVIQIMREKEEKEEK